LHKRKVAVIGLGYVGLPLAVAIAERNKVLVDAMVSEEQVTPHPVIAFDVNPTRVKQLQAKRDVTGEIDAQAFNDISLSFTSNPADLSQADFHIIAVPTPVDSTNQPDFKPLLSACETVGKQLSVGDIVVFESTVYPGATEERCLPALEAASHLTCGKDFFVGYSPERINPGDKQHSLKKIVKVVSAQTPAVLDIVSAVYESAVEAGVFRASSIKVAEAAKVIENTQRDLNIALVNELAMIFDKLNIDTADVLAAASTKWNFLPFQPGIVGGHCIGVDPYYLTYKATEVGYHPEIILAGRRINDRMGKFIAEQTIKHLIKLHGDVRNVTIGILGFSFKENCSDMRNTKVIDIYNELTSYGCHVLIHDPEVDAEEVRKHYGIQLSEWSEMTALSAIILAVPHAYYKNQDPAVLVKKLIGSKLFVDVKSIFSKLDLEALGINVWRL